VTASLTPGHDVVLLDIEGTTTPLSFVHDTLFPYARARVESYLDAHWEEPAVRLAVASLARERVAEGEAAPSWESGTAGDLRASAAAYAHWLADRDRKSPGLKALQGLIWDDGYRAGELQGQVWDDVPRAMRRWKDAGLRVAIYSSGSELAQRWLFASTPQGDLTPLIDAFFDTSVGAKTDAESYRAIADALTCRPGAMCFVSDVVAELTAARAAGCGVVLSDRPGNRPQPQADAFPRIDSFDALL
jgi:enolase-phosphatase E1